MFDDNDPKSTKTPNYLINEAAEKFLNDIASPDVEVPIEEVVPSFIKKDHLESWFYGNILTLLFGAYAGSEDFTRLEMLEMAEKTLRKWIALESVKEE